MRQHHVSTATPTTPSTPFVDPTKLGKKRGSYNCGRCGQPKKGHVCDTAPTPGPVTPRPPRPQRALSFDDVDVGVWEGSAENEVVVEEVEGEEGFDEEEEVGGGWRAGSVWEVMRKMGPIGLMAASGVCKGWREVAGRVWRAVEEVRVRVPGRCGVGFVGNLLKKCPNLVRLSLTFDSDVDATMLACIAFSCPNLESIEILISESAINLITGDELGRFIADRRCLSSLKMEGCSNLGSLVISSTSLSTLCLSDLHSLSKTIINCPNLKEVSLNFSRQENDCTDVTTMMDNLGKYCPRLQSIHVASTKLSHSSVLALTAASLRGLKLLSLVLGYGITDASVAAIAYSYTKIELLDLSGSSITDGGIGIICNVFSRTLTKLLLALCPNITSSGIQFATAQLPLLELMDCGMSVCDLDRDETQDEISDYKPQNSKLHHIYQKLIIKHSRLKKLSLWGCSGLDAVYLNCPELRDLNLTSCKNLHPERLLLQCPSLESIHAADCVDTLQGVLETLVNDTPAESQLLCKRIGDGSKRVRVPHIVDPAQQPSEDIKQFEPRKRRCTVFVQ